MDTIRKGSKGADVRKCQKLLVQHGYDIAVDGVKFKNLTKEQYELLYKLKGST